MQSAELVIAAAALLVAVVAFAHSRRVARRLAMLEEQYWELKLAHGELKAKAGAAPESQANFIPLTRLRQGADEPGPPKQ